MKALIAVVATAAALTGHAFAAAPPYPVKPVRMITPYAPGAGTDVVARLIAKDFTDAWEKQVLVDNRPGGIGAVGAMALINAPADGYTMFMGTSAVMVTNPLMSAKVAYGNVTTLMPHVKAGNLRLYS
jgi:tripartite-type tricarboxylate transporter receptor subunit TctC